MGDLMEQRVMQVSAVVQTVAPDPGPDGVGQWKITAGDHGEEVTLLVCDPPSEGDYVFVEVVTVQSSAPAGGGF